MLRQANKSWGYDRIAGTMANLGHEMSDQTDAQSMPVAKSTVFSRSTGVSSTQAGECNSFSKRKKGKEKLLHRADHGPRGRYRNPGESD